MKTYQVIIGNDFANAIYCSSPELARQRMKEYVDHAISKSSVKPHVFQQHENHISIIWDSHGNYHTTIWMKEIEIDELNHSWKHLLSK